MRHWLVVAAAGAGAIVVAEGRQQWALVVATAAVGVTTILPVELATAADAAPSLEEDLAAVAVVVDIGQLMLIAMGEAAQPDGVVAQSLLLLLLRSGYLLLLLL